MCPFDKIIAWNLERGLTEFYAPNQYALLEEELHEFYVAYSESNEHEMVDALCDIIVVATGALYKMGYNPKESLQETIKEISARTGILDVATSKWRKDPNQDPSTLYKANYESARRT